MDLKGLGQENPLKEARLKLGLTQIELADIARVTRMAVLRHEQGLYAQPSPKIVEYLQGRLGGDLVSEYHKWVTWKRGVTGLKVLPNDFEAVLKHPKVTTNAWHPLVRLRAARDTSQVGMCIGLCVNPGPVHKWESWKQRVMPEQLRAALWEAGYGERNLGYLENLSDLEYERHVNAKL